MTNKLLIIFILGLNSIVIGQLPVGRYFKNIEGTTWQTQTKIDSASIISKIRFELIILEFDVDSIQSNSIIVTFDKKVKIEKYSAISKNREVILECSYENDEQFHILTLIIGDEEVKYLYAPTSTGSMVQFFEMKK